jgi:NADH-quinone oxidoreductase subunit J
LDSSLIVFALLGLIAAASAVGVVAFGNAVRSALCLVINFFTLAFLYFSLNAELLGITQIIVYTGAIMVLFLFVIMLLNLGAPQALGERRDPKKLLGFVFGAALFAIVLAQVILPMQGLDMPRAADNYGAPSSIGRALFTSYIWPLELISVLLVVGVVGSVLLAKRKL